MKNSIIILLSLVIGFWSCTPEECCPVPEEFTIVGSWKLSKLCFSNGASSCDLEDLWDADIDETLTFTDTAFTFDREGDICSGNYTITDLENTLIQNVDLVASSGNCNFDETVFWLSSLSTNEMIFSPRCTEGCPHLYVRQ